MTADNKTMILHGPTPAFTYKITGFVNGETEAVPTTTPTCTSTGNSSSPVGSYPITCSGAAAANYTFSYVAGTLKIMFWVPACATGGRAMPSWNRSIPTARGAGKKRNTVPVKFRVCDAYGVPICRRHL